MRPSKIVLNGLVLAISALVAGAAVIVLDGLTDEIAPSDVAIVLGSKVNPDGQPSPRLAARLDRAVELHRAGNAKAIIVSGGTGKKGYPEGDVMKRYLVRHAVPAKAVIVDNAGVNTMATAVNGRALMTTHRFRSAIVVTQYFHISRSRLAFRKQGIQNVSTAHARHFEWRDIYSIAREVPGYLSYAVK